MTNYEFHPVNIYRCMEPNNGDVLDKVISDEEIKTIGDSTEIQQGHEDTFAESLLKIWSLSET